MRLLRLNSVCAALAVVAAPAAAAAAGLVAFDISAQPLPGALVAFAIQANVSIDAAAARDCRATAPLKGRFEVESGLRRLLAGTGCGYRMIDPRTIVIVGAEPRTAARPASPPPAQAAPPSSVLPEAEVQELIVTSPKRSVALSRAPYAVSVVTQSDLSDFAADADTQSLATRVAGMTVTNLGPGRDKIFLRGLSDGPLTGRTQSVVGIYLDDARIIYNAPDPDLRLTDIDRVELLRGPQGSLYGAGSIGGVIQIITRRPDLDRFGGFVSASAQAAVDGSPGGVVEGAVNAPIMPGKLAARLTAYSERVGGFIDDPGRGLKNLGGVTRQGLRASALYQPTDRLSVRLTYFDQDIHSGDSQYSEGASASRSRELTLSEPYRNDFDGLTALTEWDLGWGRLKIANSGQRHTLASRYDASLSLPFFLQTAIGPAAFDDGNRISAQVNEVTLISQGDRTVTWLVGLFVSEYGQRLDGRMTATASQLYSERRRDDIDEHAAYGEATLRLNSRLRLTLGGRLYHLSTATRSTVRQSGFVDRIFEGQTDDHGFAPKAVLEYDLAPNTLFYASSAVGYRAGGFNSSELAGQVFNTPGAGPQPYRRFAGDELTSLEAGLKATLFEQRLKLRFALFSASWQNIQTDRLLPNGLPFTANIGDAHNRGFEAEAVWRSGPLTLNGELLLNHPELARTDSGFPVPVERGLPGVADLIVDVGARHDWTLPGERAAWLGADLGYVGRSRLTFDQFLAPRMGGYVTSRFSGGVSTADWKASVFIDNPLRQKGDTFAFGNPFRIRFKSEHTPQRPLTVGVGLTRSF